MIVDILGLMVNFIEENWIAFLFRCKESGMDETEVERHLEKLKEWINKGVEP